MACAVITDQYESEVGIHFSGKWSAWCNAVYLRVCWFCEWPAFCLGILVILYWQTKSNCYSHLSEVGRRLHLKSNCYSHLSKSGRKTLNLSTASPKRSDSCFFTSGKIPVGCSTFPRDASPNFWCRGSNSMLLVAGCYLWLHHFVYSGSSGKYMCCMFVQVYCMLTWLWYGCLGRSALLVCLVFLYTEAIYAFELLCTVLFKNLGFVWIINAWQCWMYLRIFTQVLIHEQSLPKV